MLKNKQTAPLVSTIRCDAPLPSGQLWPNVIRMFDDERPPVQQHRRRGRYPKSVTTIWSWKSRRYLESLPPPHVFKMGDHVEVLFGSRWIRAVIVAAADPSPGGERRWKLLGCGELFPFEKELLLYCVASEWALRPI